MLCYDFKGINGELLTNVKAKLHVDSKNCVVVKPGELNKKIRQSKSAVKKALEPLGYFESTIRYRLYKCCLAHHIVMEVTLNQPICIHKIKIAVSGPGKNNANIQKYINKFPLKCGQIFNTNRYEEAKTKLFKITRNQGYILASFKNKILLNIKKRTADIYIHLYTGERYYFDSFYYNTRIYTDNFIDRVITINPGEPFSNRRLFNLQEAMEKSYYFKEVIFTPSFDNIQQRHIPVELNYTVPPKEKYTLGIGYGTLTGPRLSGGVSLRRLNREGHHFESDFKLSSILSRANAFYFIPGSNPLTEEWMFGATAKIFQPNSGKSKSITLTGGYLKKFEYTRLNVNLNFIFERFSIVQFNPVKTYELYPSFTLSHVQADNLANPKNGFYLSFNLQGAWEALLAKNTFIQSQLKSKIIYSPFDFARFILRGDLGVLTTHNLKTFPFSMRYFAGGINSIRGFADSSIGPGRFLYIGSVEYQQKITGNWRAAIFYDVGNATNHLNTLLNRGAGVGVVFDSVIGPAKIYLARAVSKQTQPYSIEFSIGPEFA